MLLDGVVMILAMRTVPTVGPLGHPINKTKKWSNIHLHVIYKKNYRSTDIQQMATTINFINSFNFSNLVRVTVDLERKVQGMSTTWRGY